MRRNRTDMIDWRGRATCSTSPRTRGEVEQAAYALSNKSHGHGLKRRMTFVLVAFASIFMLGAPAPAQLRGHGGPVRAVAVAPDGKTALSGSFDSSAIRWSLERNAAEQVLRFHDGAVNAVAVLPDGRFATAGEDGRIALWAAGGDRP